MQERVFSSSAYRYGFNGKEEETDGTADNYDFGARIYDGRLGRWLAVDPEMQELPDLSPYIHCYSSPIVYLDNNGNWGIFGAIIGAAAEIGGQLLSGKNLNTIDWTDVSVSAVQGCFGGPLVSMARAWKYGTKFYKVAKATYKVYKNVDKVDGWEIYKASFDNGKFNGIQESMMNYLVAKGANAFSKRYGSRLLKYVQGKVADKAKQTIARKAAQTRAVNDLMKATVNNESKSLIIQVQKKVVDKTINLNNAYKNEAIAKVSEAIVSSKTSSSIGATLTNAAAGSTSDYLSVNSLPMGNNESPSTPVGGGINQAATRTSSGTGIIVAKWLSSDRFLDTRGNDWTKYETFNGQSAIGPTNKVQKWKEEGKIKP